ncbi:MAG: protein phosphatase 2C domain-containing protein [Chloroflexi bacterium OHK40]
MRVRFSARTDVGMRREVNQDAYGAGQPGDATLLVVCDGMGGHAAGEVASQLGVETIIAAFRPDAPPNEALRTAFGAANERIYGVGHGSMGTTGVAALFLHNRLYVANVGDSRAYLVREGQITQISHDHSFVSDQVAAGLMTPEQARASSIRNIITRALGHSPEVEVDLFTVALRPGDTVVLSSDGMHGLVSDEEIAEVASMLTLDDAAQRLVDTANERGGTDNITVVLAQVDELDPDGDGAVETRTTATTPLAASSALTSAPAAPADPAERPLTRLGLALATLTLVILLGLGGFLWATGGSSPAAPTPAATTANPAPTALSTPARITPSPAPTGAATPTRTR